MSLINFSRVRLQQALKKYGRNEHITEQIIESAEKFVWTCGFYRMLCNLAVLGAVLYLMTADQKTAVHIRDIFISFGISLLLLLFFSLAIPQAWAKYQAEVVIAGSLPVISLFSHTLYPVFLLLRFYDFLIRRLIGINPQDETEKPEEKHEEFLNVVEEHTAEGVFDEQQQEMIEHVLELGETTVDKVMTPRTDIVAVDANDGLDAVLEKIRVEGHSRLPVYENSIDQIVGFIYAKDLLQEIGANAAKFDIRSRLRKAYFVPESKTLRVLLREMQTQKLQIAVVLDEYGGTAGVVTIEDIVEELVGEIADEYEQPQQSAEEFVLVDESTADVDARLHVDDLNKKFGIELPENEDYDTVGGFVFSHLGQIPQNRQSFNYGNLKIIITSAEARKINRLRIVKTKSL